MVTLVLEELAKHVAGEDHLHELDLRLEPGSFHVLLGPTAAGKTTLLRLIAGLDRPTQGRVRLVGEGAPADGDLRGRVAMVYQEFVNYPSLSVRENIAAPLRARRVAAAERERRVQEVARRLGLEALLERLPGELSGGQQQRTAIARALVQEAQVVLLDEPLANLDYKLREVLREEVRGLFEASGSIVVYATTDPAEAMWFGGRVVVLHEGRVLQHGPAREVYDSPVHEAVARATSDPPINLWDATLEDGHATLAPGVRFPLPPHLGDLAGRPCRLGLRPHHLCLAPRTEGAARIPATVELAEVDGSETLIHGRSGPLSLLAHEDRVHSFELGQAVDLFLDPHALFAFDTAGRLLSAPSASSHGQD